uniref:Uncharacterized protein n=1 Tax=Setaria italica TaxID=4555 RepID=K4AHL6_SETIT
MGTEICRLAYIDYCILHQPFSLICITSLYPSGVIFAGKNRDTHQSLICYFEADRVSACFDNLNYDLFSSPS